MNRNLQILCLALLAACPAFPAAASETAGGSTFIDIHELGPGKADPAAVANAHRADLAAQDRHGVRFLAYWVDEEHGRIYCLSQAKDAPSIVDTHREAHGLLPSAILPVKSGSATAVASGNHLYLDIHEFGPGNVSASAVAAAHEKDLKVEAQHGVHFINYWVDEVNGKVLCLSEAPGPEAVIETHRHAHGLIPQTVVSVDEGK